MSVQFRNQTTGTLERAAGFTDTDAVLSATSRNPIQNKAVHAALAQKIDKTVSDLENYYNTSQVYNKQEVRDLIGSINTLTIEVVATLPTQDISSTTIYFVGPAAGTNTYDEYVYVNNTWVKIGDTQIDLSGYVTSAALTTALQSYYDKTQTDALFNDYYDKDTTDDLLDLKQDALTFDNQPIAGSPNPVTSAGIKTALDNILISGNGGSIIKVHHTAGAAAVGDTVTASKGTYSVSSTFDTSGDAIIIGFGEIGDVTITATNGSKTGTKVINIPSFSNYSATVGYGLDYKSWLIAGGLNPSSYASLDEILADEEAIRRLMTIHDSVDYLATVESTTDEMLTTIINNNICAKWINLRDYALDTLYTSTIAKNMMDTADKYGYGEQALISQVIKMTSNTSYQGEAFASSTYSSNYLAYKAFDDTISDVSDCQVSADNSVQDEYLGYHFNTPVQINKIKITNRYNPDYATVSGEMVKNFKFQGSNNGTTQVDLGTFENTNKNSAGISEYNIINNTTYLYYRVYILSNQGNSYVDIGKLQLYAWGPKGNVPVMTSNTAPYGTAIRSGIYSSNEAWKAFDGNENTYWQGANVTPNSWVGYLFVNPVNVKAFKINTYPSSVQRIITFQIEASNDNSTWTSISEIYTMRSSEVTYGSFVPFNNNQYYLGYRVHILTTTSSYEPLIGELQFYGREMKVSVPTMTSNTAPYGEAIHGGIYSSSYDAYKAFDNIFSSTDNTRWNGNNSISNNYVGYKFTHPVIIKMMWHYGYSYTNGSAIVQASNNGVNWDNLTDTITLHASSKEGFYLNNDNAYLYYRILYPFAGVCSEYEVQFYGSDYSERDWDTEYPMKYIYDHGIELEAISNDDAGFSWGGSYTIKAPNKRIDDIELIGASNNFPCLVTVEPIDCTDYTYLFMLKPQFISSSTGNINYGVSSTKALGASIVAQVNTKTVVTGLDISSVSGGKYIYGQNSWNNSNCYVNEIWLEQ